MTRTYHDRMGRPITDPEAIEARRIRMHMRRLVTIGAKAGRPWDRATTVGELAKSTKLPPERIVAVIRRYEVWLWGLIEEGSMESWFVFEDGE